MNSVDPERTAPDESELVRRAKLGDVRAFESLYQVTSGRIFALCLRMCSDRGHATEALQDVFVRIWERLGQFRGDSSFATWAHRVCVNQLLEQRRKDARREARVMSIDPAVEPAQQRRDTSSDMDLRVDLERALPRLSEGARRVFVLHDMEGYGHDEIARLLGIAESTVRVQLHRARKSLMEILER